MTENAEFWEEINTFFEEHPEVPRPDIVLGDCNVVEDAINRLPVHSDAEVAINALDELKSQLHLVDGWRSTYPNSCTYTYSQKRKGQKRIQSRLDRIYIGSNIFENAYEWRISHIVGSQ